MKKKGIILIILIVIALCVAAFFIWKKSQPKEYTPEVIEPKVFENEAFDTDMFIGLWQSGSVFYRYNEDGSGVTWDTADDVNELEGSKFTWEVKKKTLTHFHQMEISDAIIPKAYTVTKLDLSNLEYEDDYDKKQTFIKIE